MLQQSSLKEGCCISGSCGRQHIFGSTIWSVSHQNEMAIDHFWCQGNYLNADKQQYECKTLKYKTKKITPPIAQQNWGFLGWKRQFSSDAGSSAIPGKLSSRNFVKQNLAVQLAVVFLRFRKKHKKLILRLDFTPNLYHKNQF